VVPVVVVTVSVVVDDGLEVDGEDDEVPVVAGSDDPHAAGSSARARHMASLVAETART